MTTHAYYNQMMKQQREDAVFFWQVIAAMAIGGLLVVDFCVGFAFSDPVVEACTALLTWAWQ